MAALLVAVGGTKDNPSVSADEKAGLQSLVMYFYGKLDARRPGADLKSEVMNLLAAPTYQATLQADLERCSSEAEARGQYLQSFNEQSGSNPAKP